MPEKIGIVFKHVEYEVHSKVWWLHEAMVVEGMSLTVYRPLSFSSALIRPYGVGSKSSKCFTSFLCPAFPIVLFQSFQTRRSGVRYWASGGPSGYVHPLPSSYLKLSTTQYSRNREGRTWGGSCSSYYVIPCSAKTSVSLSSWQQLARYNRQNNEFHLFALNGLTVCPFLHLSTVLNNLYQDVLP